MTRTEDSPGSRLILIVGAHDAVRRALGDRLGVEFPCCRVVEAASCEEASWYPCYATVRRTCPRRAVEQARIASQTTLAAEERRES